jgi:hypothetical protein
MRKRAEALENLATVHPHAAGLDLDAKTPPEIALAILAKIFAVGWKGSGQTVAVVEGGGATVRVVAGKGYGISRRASAVALESNRKKRPVGSTHRAVSECK